MTNKTPKVLSVCTSDSNGGAARAAYRIHQSIKKLDTECKMLVKNKSSMDSDVIDLHNYVPKNLIYKAFDWIRNKIKNKYQHYQWRCYPNREDVFMSDLRGTDINGVLRKLNYDILHLHWINQRFIPLKKLPMDKPIVWTLHDSWPFCGVCHYFADCNRYESECGDCPLLHSSKKKDLSYKVWKTKMQTYKQLDLHIVAPSQWLGLCAKHSSLFGQFPVSVIPNCIDTDVFYPQNNNKISPRWDAIEKIKAEKKIVLYGAMNALKDKRKGFKNLLAALQMIDKIGANNNIQLVVFGSDKTGLNLNTKIPIEYVGYLTNTDEIVSLYSLSDVMVVPSLDENLSCAIMESLSCQTPVVAFNIGGNSDMIDHQINGYLAKEHDDSDLARGILWCLANNEGNHLGIAGRKKVIEKFSPEVVGKQYLDLYTEAYEEFKSKKKHR